MGTTPTQNLEKMKLKIFILLSHIAFCLPNVGAKLPSRPSWLIKGIRQLYDMYAGQPHRHEMKKRFVSDPLSTKFYDFERARENGLPFMEFLKLPEFLNKMEFSNLQ